VAREFLGHAIHPEVGLEPFGLYTLGDLATLAAQYDGLHTGLDRVGVLDADSRAGLVYGLAAMVRRYGWDHDAPEGFPVGLFKARLVRRPSPREVLSGELRNACLGPKGEDYWASFFDGGGVSDGEILAVLGGLWSGGPRLVPSACGGPGCTVFGAPGPAFWMGDEPRPLDVTPDLEGAELAAAVRAALELPPAVIERPSGPCAGAASGAACNGAAAGKRRNGRAGR
jgi:hypothetical protein